MMKDTRLIIGTIMMSSVVIIGVNKAEIGALRADLRELRSLLITHISGHNHGPSVAWG